MKQLSLCLLQSYLAFFAFAVFPTRAALYSKDSKLSIVKSTLLAGTSSFLNCDKLPDVSE